MTEPQAKGVRSHWRLVAYLGVVIAVALGFVRMENRADHVDRKAAAVDRKAAAVDQQARQNKDDLDQIKADRAVRIAARCEQDHQAYVAAQKVFDAIKTVTDLIDGLINQSSTDDPKLQAILTPDQLQFFKDQRVVSEAKLANARANVDAARAQIEQNDCSTANPANG